MFAFLNNFLKMPKLGLKGEGLLLHLKYLTQSDTCFGNVLNSPFRGSIFSFERAYKTLKISITPKVHAIIMYVSEFTDNQAEKHGITQQKLPPNLHKNFFSGLWFWGEQASESVHAGFISL